MTVAFPAKETGLSWVIFLAWARWIFSHVVVLQEAVAPSMGVARWLLLSSFHHASSLHERFVAEILQAERLPGTSRASCGHGVQSFSSCKENFGCLQKPAGRP